MDITDKKEILKDIIMNYKKLLVAFSGGVDSTFLLSVAHEVLKDHVLAVTGASTIHPEGETEKAINFAKKIGVAHIVHQTNEMNMPEFIENSKNRCYVCKKQLIMDLKQIASKHEISFIAHGANVDDINDYRPGFKAAEELGAVSPLIEAGLSKQDIRALSKEMGLETWNKPAQPCLATRLPYGTPITEDSIKKIAAAEKILFDMGITVNRVRHHEESARIEVSSEDFKIILKTENRHFILDKFKKIGYLYVSLDLNGYEQGSMNRVLS